MCHHRCFATVCSMLPNNLFAVSDALVALCYRLHGTGDISVVSKFIKCVACVDDGYLVNTRTTLYVVHSHTVGPIFNGYPGRSKLRVPGECRFYANGTCCPLSTQQGSCKNGNCQQRAAGESCGERKAWQICVRLQFWSLSTYRPDNYD